MVRPLWRRCLAGTLAAWLALGLAAPATGQTPGPAGRVELPPSVPDPLEPLNRVFWGFNKGVLTWVIRPTSRVYRFVVAKPVRRGIGQFGRNLMFPGRLINNALQGKGAGARDETYRFAVNTTVGLAGFFDPATRWKIPKSDADFGQTFGQWGWNPRCFLMLPIFGPSNERDTLGLAADTAANPLLYISPYQFEAGNPLTYLGPYTYFSYAVMYNDLADTVGEAVRFSRAEMDPYAEIQYAWTFARANRRADFRVKGARDEAALETIESVFFTLQDPEFPGHGRTDSAPIPATGRKLKFTYWLQPGRAPVVYIVPGLGSHRLSQSSLALAEMVFKHGYSAVCVSSVFNSEFMEQAATVALPAYLPADGRDLRAALTEVDRRLRADHRNRLGETALLGDSMGAFHALYIAATAATNPAPLIRFDRYVAISTPVRLLYGVAKLDEFYQAPLAWPAAERAGALENTLLKAASLSQGTFRPPPSLPFDAIEARFLIGMTFRFMLRDIIYSSQRRHNQGILRQPLRPLRREPVYREILQFSYHDYFERFVLPYYRSGGRPAVSAEALAKADDLKTYADGLGANADVRVLVNQNDFLLAAEDLAWLRATFSGGRLTVFAQGGHLGNLANPEVQRTILGALEGLRPMSRQGD